LPTLLLPAQHDHRPPKPAGEASGTAPLVVTYHIDEGPQQRVGKVTLEGANQVDPTQLTLLLNTTAGQLMSPRNLAGDRDAILTSYLDRGFEKAQVDVTQQPESAVADSSDPNETDPNKTDVVFHISEGQQVFIRKVLTTGLHYTRPDTVAMPSPSMPATR